MLIWLNHSIFKYSKGKSPKTVWLCIELIKWESETESTSLTTIHLNKQLAFPSRSLHIPLVSIASHNMCLVLDPIYT